MLFKQAIHKFLANGVLIITDLFVYMFRIMNYNKKALLRIFVAVLMSCFIYSAHAVTTTKASRLATSVNTFADQMYEQMSEDQGNFVFAPLSLASMLAILYNGTSEETREQIAKALHLNQSTRNINREFRYYNRKLRLQSFCFGFYCHMLAYLHLQPYSKFINANSLWFSIDIRVKPDFITTLRQYFDADVYHIDFFIEPEAITKQLNEWAQSNSQDQIQQVIEIRDLPQSIALMAVNSIYFKGLWQSAFDPEYTQPTNFTLLDGTQVSVPMMYQKSKFNYLDSNSLRLIMLPYRNSSLAMVVILPTDKDALLKLHSGMDINNLIKLITKAPMKTINLALPKFKIVSTDPKLKKYLEALGITNLFSHVEANFKPISPHPLFLSELIQKVVVIADEKGATATATSPGDSGQDPLSNHLQFNADHPFVFFIFDRKTKVVLFIGQVLNPSVLRVGK